MKRIASDKRTCPTCNHAHPNGIGIGMCGCKDCFLIWTDIPSEYLAPEKKLRQDELYAAMEYAS